ncbi:trypsin-like peptidase domain-containing protein [bacterium]|nr:trypsin-like peptidase domain-containing protein [bacterium]
MRKIFLTILVMFWSLNCYAQNISEEERINTSIYESVYPAIVVIEGDIPNGYSTGSGCIISSDGYILTSSHVVKNAKNIEVTTNTGKVYPAKVIKTTGKNKDLALIKIEPKTALTEVKLGNSENVKVGQRVLAIGNPFGFSGTLTTGIVSRIDYQNNKIQTDAAINPGNSGGPIINVNGEVIGISQSIYNPDNNQSNIGIGFAVPVNEAKPLLKLLK